MKKTVVAVMSILCSVICIAQTELLDTAYLKCYYSYTYKRDTVAVDKINKDEMLLQIGKKTSWFYSYMQFRHDSLVATGAQMFITTVTGRVSHAYTNPLFKNFPQGESVNIYKNHINNKLIFADRIFMDKYLYEEDIPVQNWKIQIDTATISGYKCQKATCSFRGRNYIAWFTREIPVNEGPFKFGGLPGLIVQIQDDKAHYSCTLTRIERAHEAIVLNTKDYIKTSRTKYTNIYRKYISDPDKFVSEMLSLEPGDASNAVPVVWHFDIMERDVK